MTDGLRRLRQLASEPEWSQEKLAKVLGVGQQTVSAYLRRKARPADVVRDRAEARLGIPRSCWYTAAERGQAAGADQ